MFAAHASHHRSGGINPGSQLGDARVHMRDPAFVTFAHMIGHYPHLHLHIRGWQAGQMAACLRSPAAVPAAAQAERTGKILLLCLGLPGSLCLDLLERSHP